MEPPLWAWIALILARPRARLRSTCSCSGAARRRCRSGPRRSGARAGSPSGSRSRSSWALTQGGTAAGEYLSGYLIEWSLSIDNLFVFAVIFSYFAVPKEVQPRVLMYGVLGALVFRGLFIAIGAAALERGRLGDLHLRGLPGLHRLSARAQHRRARGPEQEQAPGAGQPLRALHQGLPGHEGLRPRGRPAPRDAAARRAAGHREHRRRVRHRFDPRDLRRHRRGVHRPRGQRLRGDGPAGDVLRDRRDADPLQATSTTGSPSCSAWSG